MDNSVKVNDNNIQDKKGITGSTLKLIAIITMLIDHIAATVLERMMSVLSSNTANHWLSNFNLNAEQLHKIYFIMRAIGRIAFPIFCFLLVEGFIHTRNVWKYALRLAIFALVSEIPFNLALFAEPFNFSHQNVFFTLLIGLLVLIGMKYSSEKFMANKVADLLVGIVILVAGCVIAELLNTDYSAMGILTITIMYVLRKSHIASMLGGCVVLALLSFYEIFAVFALIPASFYNSKRGLKLKYIFYIFYPAHLFILYLICNFMRLL